MIESETKIRVRYGETDQMGYAYYGVYAMYYEVGRVETMRILGFSYKDVEARGILMPVLEYNIKYKKPAYYDEELTIVTRIKEMPTGVKVNFDYECFNEKKELINVGFVTLAIVDKNTGKLCKLPDWFSQAMSKFFM
jgi:acyl-CoA thioester hydrolase